ncbi:hypothetical protein P3T18_007227 [Paraburkholderia sp. GAS199]
MLKHQPYSVVVTCTDDRQQLVVQAVPKATLSPPVS